jgi:DNA-binding response OmpR family regulator
MWYTKAGGVNMRILVVEDEKDLNRLISKRLAKEGYVGKGI